MWQEKKDLIVLTAIGSRGDMQPVLELAKEFKKTGYRVRIIANEVHRSFFLKDETDKAFQFYPLSGYPLSLFCSPEGSKSLIEGNGMKILNMLIEAGRPYIRKNMEEIEEGILWFENGDSGCSKSQKDIKCTSNEIGAIIYNFTTAIPATTIAEAYKIPCFGVYTIPIYPTREFPPPIMGLTSLPFKFMNNWAYSISNWVGFKMMSEHINWFRTKIGMYPLTRPFQLKELEIPVFHICSPLTIPRPPDWPQNLFVVGSCSFPPDGWQPHEKLAKFLISGSAPVYIGFGSMPVLGTGNALSHILKSLENLNLRGILCGEVQDLVLPDSVILIKSSSHEWLFPKCCAAVHHGGAGTTHAALRAGIPQIICPVFGDQPFWANTMVNLGVASKSFSFKDLNAVRFTEALNFVMKPDIQNKAKELGNIACKENGIDFIVKKVKERLNVGDS